MQKPVVLVGFMGSGKTTVGRALASHIGGRFLDLDDLIEAAQKRTIAQIFETEGESAFRQIEHEALGSALAEASLSQTDPPLVLALGGGAFPQEPNQLLLSDTAITCWLDVPFARALQRVQSATHRPLARDPHKFEQLYQQRIAAYQKANHRIPIESDDPKEAVAVIAGILQKNP